MNIVFIGPQGSGKGTQAHKLCDDFGFTHIAPGDIIREGVANKEPAALKLQSYTDAGKLVPSELLMEVLKPHIESATKGIVFDGFPRNLDQAHALDEVAEIDCVIELKLSDEEALDRISHRRYCPGVKTIYGKNNPPPEKCPDGSTPHQRADDTPEAIKVRLNTYREETEPLLEYYKPRDIVHSVDASQSVEEIYKQICNILE